MHTVHTIMPSISSLRVHIAPVGYEIDRIVLPAKEMKADKVWLLIHDKPNEDKALSFIDRIEKKLKRRNLVVIKNDLIENTDYPKIIPLLESINQILNRFGQRSFKLN